MKELFNDQRSGLSRRDALKVLGASPFGAATLLGAAPQEAEAAQQVKGRIVIAGGGAGGIMALSRLLRSIKDPDITIITPNKTHLYQPGQVFVAAGLMQEEDLKLKNASYIDRDVVKWEEDEVASFEPEHNRVVTKKGKRIEYDVLLVATGIAYHYEKIKGLKTEDIGKNGISSVYLNDLAKGTAKGGPLTWQWFNDVREAARSKRPKVLFTQPNTPIKCGGAPQKMLYLCADFLKQEGLGADYEFVTSIPKLFSLPKIDVALQKVQKRYDTITNRFQHYMESIDVAAKKATFIHAWEEKVIDPDFGEEEIVSKSEKVELEYDFIHIVPPMSPVEAVMESDLLSESGWLDVDKHTLQHKKYDNVFGIGDVCGVPMGKTGGSARHHGPVVVANMIAHLQGKKLPQRFDGYTVCPIKTQYGKIIMAEFNYKGPAPTIPFLAYDEPRWMWWAFDLYMLEPMYKYLMLTGRM